MRKYLYRVGICLLAVCAIWTWMLIKDRQKLRQELIRFHVVAASDEADDQAVKLQVRDAIIEALQAELQNLQDMEQAKAYLRENLPKIQTIANNVLEQAGFEVLPQVEGLEHRVDQSILRDVLVARKPK